MTSVRDAVGVPPQRPAIGGGPKCHCGTPIARTPGKRPKIFCSEACRSAARRATNAAKKAAETAGQSASGKSGRLGKGLTEFSKSLEAGVPAQVAKTEAAKVERAAKAAIRRYQGRKVLNRTSAIDACNGCGARVLDPETGVIYAQSSRGYVVTIGLVRCGRIWFCPECSASIRRGRTDEVKTGALRHLAAGGTLAVVVLTARHNRTHELARLNAGLWGEPMLTDSGEPVRDRSGRPRRSPGAYQRMLTAPEFYGRPESVSWWQRKDGSFGHSVRAAEEGIRHKIGYAGMVRASEVTRSLENGWHPHMNLLVFLGAKLDGTPAKGTITSYFEPSAEALKTWENWLRQLWTEALAKADPEFKPSTDCDIRGCKCQGKGHGVMVKIITSADDAALIDYMTKVQDGKRPDSVSVDLAAAGGAAMETVRADNKIGRGRKSMTPFQILYRLWDIEVAGLSPKRAEGYGTVAQCRAWWAEYETAMAGRRAIEWTRGLRRHVQLDGDDSEETDKQFIYQQEKDQALTGGVILTSAASTTVVDADAELDMQAVIEAKTYEDAAKLVERLGGRADHVRVATAAELAEVQQNLYARLNAKTARVRAERLAAEMLAKYKPHKPRMTEEDLFLSPEGADFREKVRDVNQLHADDVAAAFARFRGQGGDGGKLRPYEEWVPKVWLLKPPKPPRPGQAATVCRNCDGMLDPVLQPYGQHVDDCTRRDKPLD